MTVLIGLVCQVFAQSEYHQGYIITMKGDTVNGFIEVSASNGCVFKKDFVDAVETIYSPYDIQGFGFSQRYIVSKPVSSKTGNIERVFMDCLILGQASLYQYLNLFYVEKADSLFLPLLKSTVINSNSGSSDVDRISTAGNYIGTLSYLLSDCPGIRQSVQNAKYTRNDFTELIKNYNKCRST